MHLDPMHELYKKLIILLFLFNNSQNNLIKKKNSTESKLIDDYTLDHPKYFQTTLLREKNPKK